MSWDTAQLRILRELGHEPMLLAGSLREPAAPANGFAALQAALQRAAGGRDVSTLVPDLGRLRDEPALKRALWPSLRALRRGH